ncbi:MAG: hypothetical protein COT26_02220 [Candidatus Kerfeldbacteria bacterium CG08_land_8_20_14_0_20_43_14]|uniref:Uncharacterized protein n=1 Tax=Candidatus Kerfeldbacteria bacterium CG08_land_8_20_14_0_20_43_14 TaxID=2014246 RepID=A0A2H0YSC5_9BACT|nr:MAG: hypothetical protein COT26_02220 [Candidatus Kerfeldbacteria bacterium CG08_land_8_20_14_0_20_43_14]
MIKKSIILATIIVSLILVLAASAFVYNKKKDYSNQVSFSDIITIEKLLGYKIKDVSLSGERISFYQEKFKELKTRIQKTPEDINAWLSLGMTKKSVNDFEGARDVFLYVTQKYPTDAVAFGNLGDLYSNFLKEPQKAEEAYKQALRISSGYSSYYIGLGEVYLYLMPEKTSLYEQVMLDGSRRFPQDPYFISSLASYYKKSNQTQKAIEQYEKLIQLDPQDKAVREDLAELKLIKN